MEIVAGERACYNLLASSEFTQNTWQYHNFAEWPFIVFNIIEYQNMILRFYGPTAMAEILDYGFLFFDIFFFKGFTHHRALASLSQWDYYQ